MLPTDLTTHTSPSQSLPAPNDESLTAEESSKKAIGRWTKEEHQRFVDGLKKFGKNWKRIEEYVGTRNGAQIRSHAQKFFLRLQKEYDIEGKTTKGPQSDKDDSAAFRKDSGCSYSTTCSNQEKEKSSGSLNFVQDAHIEDIKVPEPLVPKKTEPPICVAPVVNNISLAINNLALNQFIALNNFQQKQRSMSIDALPPVFSSNPLYDMLTAKIQQRPESGLDFPLLSDLLSLNLATSLPTTIPSYYHNLQQLLPLTNNLTHAAAALNHFNNNTNTLPLRIPQRKFSEDNVLIQNRQEQLHRLTPSEFEMLSKKLKKL